MLVSNGCEFITVSRCQGTFWNFDKQRYFGVPVNVGISAYRFLWVFRYIDSYGILVYRCSSVFRCTNNYRYFLFTVLNRLEISAVTVGVRFKHCSPSFCGDLDFPETKRNLNVCVFTAKKSGERV